MDQGNVVWNNFCCRIHLCVFTASSLRSLLTHMTHSHSEERNLFMKCTLDGCVARWQTADAFRVHVIRYHRHLWLRAAQVPPPPRPYHLPVIPMNDVHEDFALGEMDVAVDDLRPEQTFEDMYNEMVHRVTRDSLRMRLAMEHKYETPASTVAKMHEDVQKFLLSMVSSLESLTMKKLAHLGHENIELYPIFDFVNFSNALYVGKRHLRLGLQQFSYIEPVRLHLSIDNVNRSTIPDEAMEQHHDNDDGALMVVQCDGEPQSTAEEDPQVGRASGVMHYIPIMETLKRYLSHDDVVESVLREETGVNLERYTSAALFRTHPIFQNHPEALRIILYTDEFEVCNPIGSNRGKHKMFGVYFAVGNVEQHNLSDLSSIHLALLCEYPNVVKYSYEQVLQPLLDDLKILESQGITVRTRKGHEHHWLGGVPFVCGDNLSQNAIGGFRRCFSEGKACRFCMAPYSSFNTLMTEQACILRTPDAHAMHVHSVLRDKSLIPVYGVNGPSPLDALQIGSVIDILCPDILHDVLEGVLVQHMTLLIRGLNTRKVVKMKEIIRLVSSFRLGRNDKRNKHPGIPTKFSQKKYSLIGSASQKWNLFRIFSLAVGPSVPEDDKFWKFYLLFNRMCDIIFAGVIDHDWLILLQTLIEEHQRTWVELYPTTAVYKLHALLHLVRTIVKLGAPRHFWTMRFEAFHQFFKRTAVKLRNFTCISKTLSERYEKRRAMEYSSEEILPPRILPLTRQLSVTLKETPQLVKESIIARYQCCDNASVVSVCGVKVCGVRYFADDFVVIDVFGDGTPLFLKIKYIYRGNVVLLGYLSYVVGWKSHIHAYEVHVSNEEQDFAVIESEQVVSPQTLDGYVIGGKTYIKMQYRVVTICP